MNRLTLFLFISISLVLGACSAERVEYKKMRKLKGSWRFHKVKYKEDSRIFSSSKEITDDFKDIEWVFTKEGEVMQIQLSIPDTTFGTYELEYDACAGSDYGRVYDIHFHMVNKQVDYQSVDHFIWEDAYITNTKINTYENLNQGLNKYVLKKD